jgi:replicative DNA helicase
MLETEPLNFDLSQTISQHMTQAERLFAGGVFLDPDHARKTCSWLDPGLIRDEKLRKFWEMILAGRDEGEAAVDAGAYFEIASYMNQVTSLFDTPAFAKSIADDRYLIEASTYLGDMAKTIARRDLGGLKALAECIANAAPYTGESIPDAYAISAEFEELLDNLDGRVETTGITNFDRATGGLEKETLTVIAARPSMGKTSLGLQIAQDNAGRGRKVLLFSLEMSRASLWARMACGKLQIAWRDVLAKRVSPQDIARIKGKSQELAKLYGSNLRVDDISSQTSEDVYRKVSTVEPDLIIVDHMGLLNRAERGRVNDVVLMGNVSRMGKVIAKQFGIPAIYLVQLSRAVTQRDSKIPDMSDLRASGEIEENADNIIFIHRKDYYEDPTETPPVVSETQLIVSKFRNGVRNINVNVEYHLDKQWFYPPATEQARRTA